MPGRKPLMRACGRLDTATAMVNSMVLALLVLLLFAGLGVAERDPRVPRYDNMTVPQLTAQQWQWYSTGCLVKAMLLEQGIPSYEPTTTTTTT